MAERILLETARASDGAAIEALLEHVELPTQGIREHIDHFVVARDGDRLIGCVGFEVYGEYGLLRSLAVHPDYRGRGLGVQLAEDVISRARQSGLRQAVILTKTIEPLARRLGFESVARQTIDPRVAGSWEFQAEGCQSAVCMQLNLV